MRNQAKLLISLGRKGIIQYLLRSRPPAVGYRTHPFLDGNEPIGRDLLKSFVQATWPINVDVRRSGAPQTEMQAGIAAREKAGLTQDRLRLDLASVVDKHPGSNGASIGLYAFQFHFDPIGLAGEVIAQERGRLVEIDDQNVDVPVVVEVSKRASPTAVWRRYTGTSLRHYAKSRERWSTSER